MRKLAKLKAAIYEAELTRADLAKVTGKSPTYISLRLNNHKPFTTTEIQQIGTLLHIPREQWLDYFMAK